MGRYSAILMQGILLVALLALPRTAHSADERLERVVVGVPSKVVQFAPFYLGVKKGIYAAEGLHVEVVQCGK